MPTGQPLNASNKRVLCGVIAISAPLWGGFGIHKFLLGYIGAGIIHLLLTFVGVGVVISVIEGVIYVLKIDDEFYQTYQQNRRHWF
jgi:TM2 domain-containing membrane protein YozV